MDRVKLEDRDGVTLVTLSDGKANAMGTEMIRDLADAARQLAKTRGGIVVTGTGRFFSCGLDLAEVSSVDRSTLGSFVDRFEDMAMAWFALERPVVAAVNGFAIAGGAILALAADHRLIASTDTKIGLNEVALGIVFPAVAIEIVRAQISPSVAGRVLLGSELVGPSDAVALGLADRQVPPESLIDEALALARRLAAAPGQAYARTKATLRLEATARIQSQRHAQRDGFIDSLMDPAVKAHLRGVLEALKSRKAR